MSGALKVCFIPFAHASIENLASHNVTVAASKGCRKAWLESAYAGRDARPLGRSRLKSNA